MERVETKLGVRRSASASVILPIGGMMGGLLVGLLRTRFLGLADLALLACMIRWSVTGFFAGLGLVLLLAVQFRHDVISIRRLMVLVAVAAVVAWFFVRVFFDAIGFQGF
jgi:hypothetical protein